MSFETPAALWGLGALLLLAIFSLFRQAAERTVVPSLRLWTKIPERNPPIRALRRPAWRWDLLFYALAIAAAVLGLAGPFVELDRPKPRRIGIVIDTSARMRDRLGRMVERAREVTKHDEASFYAADPAPRKEKDPGAFRIVDVHVDVEPLLAVARAENERVVLFSDRAPAGVEAELFGGPKGNAGIVEFGVSDGEVFARIANHGAARRVTASLKVDGVAETKDLELPPGEIAWFEKRDLTTARAVSLALPPDAFPADDVASASRAEAVETAVSVSGLDHPLVRRALAAVPGVALRDVGAAVAIGIDAEPGPAPFRVKLHAVPAPRREDLELRPHALTAGLREPDLRDVGEVPAGGEVLIAAKGRPVMALDGATLHVAVSLETWKATPSFPIFWSNVIQFARRGKSAFSVERTGTRVWTVAEGASLLDARETDAEGTSKPASWGVGAPGTEKARTPLGGWAAGAALALVAVAWILRGKTD